MSQSRSHIREAFSYAFPLTVPIGVSFLFLGVSYGLYAVSQGFAVWLPLVMALIIFAGSLEFVMVSILLAPFDPLGTFLLALMVNARHIFYGISMLGKYGAMGWKKYLLIGTMCDESFAINVSTKLPEHIDKGWFFLFVSLLNYGYWVIGSALGGIAGDVMTFLNLKGIEFVLVALFATIFLETLLSASNRNVPKFGIMGICVSLVSLLIFGESAFIVPAMIGMLILSLGARQWGGVRFD